MKKIIALIITGIAFTATAAASTRVLTTPTSLLYRNLISATMIGTVTIDDSTGWVSSGTLSGNQTLWFGPSLSSATFADATTATFSGGNVVSGTLYSAYAQALKYNGSNATWFASGPATFEPDRITSGTLAYGDQIFVSPSEFYTFAASPVRFSGGYLIYGTLNSPQGLFYQPSVPPANFAIAPVAFSGGYVTSGTLSTAQRVFYAYLQDTNLAASYVTFSGGYVSSGTVANSQWLNNTSGTQTNVPGGAFVSFNGVFMTSYTTNPGHLCNASMLTNAGPGAQNLIIGFVIGGNGVSGSMPALVRAVGPSLYNLGIPNFLPDPYFSIVAIPSGNTVGSNDNWNTPSSNGTAVSSTGAQVGAFALASPTSLDAALVTSLTPGVYCEVIGGNGSPTGMVLGEVYDATVSPSLSTPHLVNVSARAQVSGNFATIGFVIAGSSPQTVMLRAVGPTLASQGVSGYLPDPQLNLYSGGIQIAANDNWCDPTSNPTYISSVASQVGAFSLPTGSKDSVLLLRLQPGVYSAQMTGVGGSSGIGLLEAYAVP